MMPSKRNPNSERRIFTEEELRKLVDNDNNYSDCSDFDELFGEGTDDSDEGRNASAAAAPENAPVGTVPGPSTVENVDLIPLDNVTQNDEQEDVSMTEDFQDDPNYVPERIEYQLYNSTPACPATIRGGVESSEMRWFEPNGDLFDFPCSEENAVTAQCLDVLKHTNYEPLDFFNLFVDNELVDLIVTETNRYAEQQTILGILEDSIAPNSRWTMWKPTDRNEIRLLIGLMLWIGLDQRPSIRDYWRQCELYSNTVSKRMSRNRFQALLTSLHFADNEIAPPGDRLHKVGKLLEVLNRKFSLMFEPGEKITIDESMIPFRGRLSFRQYNPQKTNKYGVKVYKLCLINGYTWFCKIYAGKEETPTNGFTVTTNTTLELVNPLLDKGRTLYVDNFYTSVQLAEQLLIRRTHLVGTLRANRRLNPVKVVKTKLKRGQMIAKQCHKKIIVGKWKDKRDVLFLTTKSVPELVQIANKRDQIVSKPSTIVDYNTAKGFIDLSDQLASYNSPLRKSVKWYRKVAMEFLLGTTVVNAHRLFLLLTNKRMSITDFRERIVLQIFEEADKQILEAQNMVKVSPQPQPSPARIHEFQEAHTTRGRCVPCYEAFCTHLGAKAARQKSKQVRTACAGCEAKYMCIDCFMLRHKCSLKERFIAN